MLKTLAPIFARMWLWSLLFVATSFHWTLSLSLSSAIPSQFFPPRFPPKKTKVWHSRENLFGNFDEISEHQDFRTRQIERTKGWLRIRGSWPGIFVAMASTSSIPENYEDQRQKRIEKNNTILSKLLPGITCQRKKKVVSPAPSPPTPPLEIKHVAPSHDMLSSALTPKETGLPIARKRLNMGRKNKSK